MSNNTKCNGNCEQSKEVARLTEFLRQAMVLLEDPMVGEMRGYLNIYTSSELVNWWEAYKESHPKKDKKKRR